MSVVHRLLIKSLSNAFYRSKFHNNIQILSREAYTCKFGVFLFNLRHCLMPFIGHNSLTHYQMHLLDHYVNAFCSHKAYNSRPF